MDMTLPPGQHAVEGFPRFGTHLHRPPPDVPAAPEIEIRGAVAEPLDLPLTELASLPRHTLDADFHCVAGWSATGLRWEGVPFETFYRRVIEPRLKPGATITHVVLGGLDGFETVVVIEDALADDVLIAEQLDGRPLDSDHGAPARLVSPSQYGYMSTKHLCRIELHTHKPRRSIGAATTVGRLGPRHPRARAWEEERHPQLPAWSLRPLYRALIPPIRALSARGSRINEEEDG
jgi:DMSO/TMAO reductase YedYZ molybdopterin-dependent catalytic subunit